MRGKRWRGKRIGMLALILVLLAAAGQAGEEITDASGQWLYVLEDGGATITWMTAEDPTGELVIPSELDGYPVTGIGKHAFAECESLTGVTVPEGVTRIGDSAFTRCLGLARVTLPESLTSIGEMAFYLCGRLTSVVIPESVVTLGDGAFMACRRLTHATLPDGLRTIGDEVFYDCKNLTLLVAEGSYADQYARANQLKFSYKQAERASPVRSVDGLHQIQPSTDGTKCDFAYVGGWTITKRCKLDKQGKLSWSFCGQADGSDKETILVKDAWYTDTIIPCGDSFVYYNGSRWLVYKPGKKATRLPVTYYESVFYGFDGGCWYAEQKKVDGLYTQTLYAIDLNGKNKRLLGIVDGFIVGVLADASIVLADYYGEKTVSTWKDGVYTVLYASPDEKLGGVYATQDSVWVSRDGTLGRIENGTLHDIQKGYVQAEGRTAHQLVFLVRDHLGADEADVLLIQDSMHAYTYLGRVPYVSASGKGMELHADHVVYWGKGRHVLAIPSEPSAWTSYE